MIMGIRTRTMISMILFDIQAITITIAKTITITLKKLRLLRILRIPT